MSQANVEIAKRANDAFNRRDVDAAMECATSDIEFVAAMSGTVAGGSLKRREGIEALFADIRDTWEEHRMVIEEIRDLGERVLGLGRLEGRGKASGVSVDVPFALISDFATARCGAAEPILITVRRCERLDWRSSGVGGEG
jgi:ketosteroid isomerase-like protein